MEKALEKSNKIEKTDFKIYEEQAEAESENIETLHADKEQVDSIREHWPYDDFRFEEWQKNGNLITRDGLPSRLPENYYKLVRTDSFKKWFGDWENPQNDKASIVVNSKTGEPFLWYRGDKSRYKEGYITKTEDEKTPKEGNPFINKEVIMGKRNQGVFFTNNIDVAISYAEDIHSFTLGKYDMDYAKDHPETFEKMRSWLISNANTDKTFWSKIFGERLSRKYISDEELKERFHLDMSMHGFNKEDSESLWNEVYLHRRSKKPEYYIDKFIKKGQFESLIGDYMQSQPTRIYDDGFGEHYYLPFGYPDIQDWQKDFRDQYVKFKEEPVVLASVFLRAQDVGVGDDTSDYEIYESRINGQDGFLNKNAVGNGRAHEFIVFDEKDIWIADKKTFQEIQDFKESRK